MIDERVLLIDDNDDQRSSLAAALRERGWHVSTARSGRIGLELAARDQPSIVLTELILPDVRGLSFARVLRHAIERDVRVIALTRIPEQLYALARKAGFDHVQHKPVDVDALHDFMLGLIANAFPIRKTVRG